MEQDHLSNLPENILHDILSRLSEKDVARTSVLSKAWAETWSTFPFLSFSETKIVGRNIMKRKKFCDIAKRTLLKFCNQGLEIKQFKLFVNNFQDLEKDVNLWLKMVCESGVKVLELHQRYNGDQCYILPKIIFEAKSLTKLVLSGKIGVDLPVINHSVKIFSLKVLSLKYVCLGDEQQLKHLISLFPLIEYITLDGCSVYSNDGTHLDYIRDTGIKSLTLDGLPRLKSIHVQGIQEVNVDAPRLEDFLYIPRDLDALCKIDFYKCRNLRWLHLVCSESTIITEKWFHELFRKFSILESLTLCNCTMPRRINISSDQLKVLLLSPCSNLKEINIVAPNLVSSLYPGFRSHVAIPNISFRGCTSQLIANIKMDIDYHDLCNFKKFIKIFVLHNGLPSKSISLYTHWPIVDELDQFVLKASPTPPPSIKHLVLRNVPDNEALYLPFVNRLLLSCFPTTISLSSDSNQCNKTFIEVFYEMLMGKNKHECFCNIGRIKCWWHDLKGVKVSSSMKSGENVDFKTILDAFQTYADMDTISFRLEF